jgi:hypothetical protein
LSVLGLKHTLSPFCKHITIINGASRVIKE